VFLLNDLSRQQAPCERPDTGTEIDLTAAIGASEDGGVEHGAALMEFSAAVVDNDDARMAAARAAVIDAVGEAGFVDAAAIASTFNAIDRVADSTGMPLSEQVLEETAAIREELGLNDFLTAGGD